MIHGANTLLLNNTHAKNLFQQKCENCKRICMKSCEISFEILKSNQNPEILIKILKSDQNLEILGRKKEDFEILSVILLGC